MSDFFPFFTNSDRIQALLHKRRHRPAKACRYFVNPKSCRSSSSYHKSFLLLPVMLFALAAPDRLFCSMLRYQSVAFDAPFLFEFVCSDKRIRSLSRALPAPLLNLASRSSTVMPARSAPATSRMIWPLSIINVRLPSSRAWCILWVTMRVVIRFSETV